MTIQNAISIIGLVALIAALEVQVRLAEEPYLLAAQGDSYRTFAHTSDASHPASAASADTWSRADDQAGGYGVGVAEAMLSAYVRSIATRIAHGFTPLSSISITSRVTPRQISQVGAIESNTTLPSAPTLST